MNKKEFIDMIANKASLTKKDAEIALQAVTDGSVSKFLQSSKRGYFGFVAKS